MRYVRHSKLHNVQPIPLWDLIALTCSMHMLHVLRSSSRKTDDHEMSSRHMFFLSTCRSKNSNSRYISRQRYSVTLLSIELCLKTTLHQAAFGSDLKSTWSRVYPFPCPPPEGKRNSSPRRPFSLRPVKVSVSPPITFFPFPVPTSGQILKSTVTVKERETGPRQSLFVGIVREMMC